MTNAQHRPPASIRLLVTAGPTHEPIDAVRYIANRSSGRLGLAIAVAATGRGLPTTLLLGPTALRPPDRTLLSVHRFRDTASLQELLDRHWPQQDVLIMAAAVADYRPVTGAIRGDAGAGKIARGDQPIALHLEPTPDLVADLARTSRADQRIVAFALEPAEGLLESARAKLQRKGAHAIVANPLETMDAPTISAILLLRGGRTIEAPPEMEKDEFAEWLLDRLGELR
jgi:phosphopantothenoylcysteine decarboxylase / phosphopantothenate---cysteine ligase